MKNFKFTPTSVILLVTFLLSNSIFSQNTVTPTSGAEWIGYVNAFSISDGEFQFGEVYQVESMKSTITSTSIELQPNFEIWEQRANDGAWFDDTSSTQTPLVYIEGNTYAENNNYAGSDLTFTGNVSEADLDAGYTAVAFIKALDAENNYATVVNNSVDITSAGDFTVSATAAELVEGYVIQYGFTVTGPLADPATEASLGGLLIGNIPGSNNPPVAQLDFLEVEKNASQTSINVIANDTDSDDDALTLIEVSTSGSGIIEINSDGVSIDYTPEDGFSGTEIITYTVSDGELIDITGTLYISVNLAPPATNAPTPPVREAEDVISIYSDAYTVFGSPNYNPSWSTGTIVNEYEPTGEDPNSVLKYSNLVVYQGLELNGIVDASSMEFLHVDIWTVTEDLQQLNIFARHDNDGTYEGSSEAYVPVDIETGQWKSFDIPISDFVQYGISMEFLYQLRFQTPIWPSPAATIYVDNIYFWKEPTIFDDGLLTNGDFENGSASWIEGVDDNSAAPVVTTNGNTHYQNDVASAGNPWDVNTSQKVEIIDGNTYTLTFDAWGSNRSLVAGIGLSADPWSSSHTNIDITTTRTTYSFTGTADGWGAADARVIFDLGAEVGLVNIDNVSLFVANQESQNPPVAVDDTLEVQQNASLTSIDVIANDTDADGDTLTLIEASTQGPGIANLNSDGVSIDYTPATDFTGDEIITYTVDDGQFTAVGTLTVSVVGVAIPPTTNAPTPPARDTENVISIYSDAYTNIDVNNFNPNWGQSGSVNATYDPTGEGENTVLEYSNFNFQGTQLEGNVDASAMQYVHIDIFTSNATSVKFSPICFNTSQGETEFLVDVPLVTGQWSSVDIPITEFTGMTWDSVFQLKFDGNDGVSPSTIYLDNIYFWKSDEGLNAPVAVNDTFEVEQNASLTSIDVLANDTDVDGDMLTLTGASVSNGGIGIIGLNSDGVSIDYTPAENFIGYEIIYYTITDGVNVTTGTLTVSVGDVSPVTNAPTPPVREAEDVISIYSDAYTVFGSANFDPMWDNGLTIVNDAYDPTGEGTNTVLQYTNFNNVGVELNEIVDASLMEYVHVDFWTPNFTNVRLRTWVDNDGNGIYDSGSSSAQTFVDLETGQWTSVDIPISDFEDTTWEFLFELSFGKNASSIGAANLFVDNIYFWKEPTEEGQNPPVAVDDTLEVEKNASLTSVDVIANDTDLDGDTLTLTEVSSQGTGTVSVNSDGVSIDYTPAENFAGTELIIYTVSDGTNTDPLGRLTVTVGDPSDTSPITNAPTPPAREAENVISIYSNAYATSGSHDYEYNPNQVGSVNTVYDPTGEGVNTVLEYVDILYQGILLENSIDASAMEFVHIDVWTVDAPRVRYFINGYSPDINIETGQWSSVDIPISDFDQDTFSSSLPILYIDAREGLTEPSKIYVDNIYFWRNPNNPPVAVNDTFEVNQNASEISIDVIGNDTDADGDTLELTEASAEGPGYAEPNPALGTVIYTPADGFIGTEIITYTITDGTLTATGTLTVTVNEQLPTTNAPTPPARDVGNVISVYSDAYTGVSSLNGTDFNPDWGQTGSVNTAYDPTGEGTNTVLEYSNFNYQGTDFDPVADPIDASMMEFVHIDIWTADATFVMFSPINSDGITEYLVNVPLVTGQWSSVDIPISDFTGMTWDSLYQLKFDGQGGVTPSKIYLDNIYFWKNINIVTVDDTLTVLEDSNLRRTDVIANDTDNDGDSLSLIAVITDGIGTVGINTDNVSVNYTPAANFNGTETITYTVSDGTNTAQGTLTVTVTAVNDAPIAAADTLTINEDASLTSVDVISNDLDVDGDNITITEVTTDGTGIVDLNADGLSIDYTPVPEFYGTEVITYTITDGTLTASGTLTVTVSPVNDNIPVTVADELTVDEDASLTSVDVISNDTDADGDTLTLTEVITDGTGTVAVNADGLSVDYTPAADFNGIEIITYSVSDGFDTVTGTLTITVTAVNDIPVAVADTASVDEDTALTVDVISNDTHGDGDSLSLLAATAGGTGSVSLNADGLSVDYTPAANFNGIEIITYTVSDGEDTDETGTLTITVNAVNDAPVAVSDIATVEEDADLTSINVISNDTDVDEVTLILTSATTTGSGTVAVNTDGLSIDYTPASDFNGTEIITYTLFDGELTDTTGTLTITVTAVNDVPVTVADIATVIEDAALTSLDVVSNDTHGDGDTLTLISATTQGTGTVTPHPEDGISVDYTPAADFNGTEIITYTVSDGTDTSTGTLTVTVTAVNDAPVAVAEATSVFEDAPLTTIDVVSNDTDVDGDTLTLLAATSDGNGIIEINADGLSIDYTPAANFNGIEIITYTVSDGELSDTTGTLTITVTTVKDPPVAVADTETVLEDAALTSIDVISNDTDSDGDTLILSSVSTNGSGTVTVNPNRLSVDYTPAADFNGTEIVTYVVSDRSFTATGTLTITVTPVNDAPVAIADIATVIEDATLTNIDVVSNDIHGDGDTLTLTAVSSDGNGIIAINEDGLSVDYTPAADFNGTETITYTVSESEGDETDETGTLTITVTSVNDLPIAVADELTVEEDAALTSKDVIENDTDIVEGDTLTLTAVVTDGNGTVAVNADGVSVDYTPASNFNGIETITYTVSDGTDTVTSTLTITVTEVNDAPVAVADIATVVEDAALTSINVINNDTDFDGDTLTLTAVASDGNGTIEINEDGVSVDYTPASDFDGTEIITYTVFDGELSDTTGTLTITVTPVNDNLPIAVADELEIDEDAALTSTNVIENDTDLDTQDTLTLTTVVTDGNGTVAVNADGLSVDYIPAADFNGTEIITYSVSDGTDTDNSGTLTITVNPINDAPVANDDREIIPEDSSIQFFEVLSNDTDVEDDYLYITELSTNGSGIIVLNEDSERINYTPAQGFKGTEIVTYTVTDGDLEDTTGTLTILVSNDAREITAITSNSSSQVETGSFEITATISSASDVDVVIPFTTSGDAVNNIDYRVDFNSEGEETTILNTGQDTYGKMTVTPNGKLVFYQNGQIKVYDPTTEILEEASFSHQMYWGSKVTGNTTMLGHYQNLLHKYDFSDLNNITEELVFNAGNRSIEGYFQDGDTIYFGVENNGIRTLFKKVGNEITQLFQTTNYSLNNLFIHNNRVLLIENWGIYEIINPGSESFIVSTQRFRDNNGSDMYIDQNKVVTYNNELYSLYNQLPGRIHLPPYVEGDPESTPIFTPLEFIAPTGDIQDFGFDSASGDLYSQNISYDNQGYSIYTVNSYRVSPVIKINAGETTGNFTITGIDDDFYELSESIIVSPGIPVNASYADALFSNGNVTPLTLELSDDDEKADVTFAFSSPTIQEFPYETVTLTATLSAVSGVDVTVPFILSANASTTVDVSATEILIAAGQTSGSVSISTTEAFDDSLVELQESITFSFDNTTIVNATTSETDVALIVLSDDNPVITSIGSSGGIMTQDESGSFEITASVDLVSSKDVLIPITLSGDARYDEDYSAAFASRGEKTTIIDLGSDASGRIVTLPDGRYVILHQRQIIIYDPLNGTKAVKSLNNNYESNIGLYAESSTVLYSKPNQGPIYKIDITDVDNIIETEHISLPNNNWVDQPFYFDGETFLYQVYDGNNGTRKLFKKVGDADSELINNSGDCCFAVVMINNIPYAIWQDGFAEIGAEGRFNHRNFNNFRIDWSKLVFHNNEIYALNTNDNNKLGKLVITDNQVTFEDLPITEDSTIEQFDFDNSGNIIAKNYEYENALNSYSISSYQLLPQLKIPAGQTTGNFTITGIDDALYELSESLVVSPGTAVNATYSDALVTDGAATPLTLELTDNDDLSEVTYAFSSPTIDENSATTVTLTASSVSGAEITIPFTLTQDATSAVLGEEYIIVDDVRQIVIPANGNSASITISTTGLDDTDVEIQEPIMFNFGTLVNATSTVSDVTLNLLSDDNSVITAIGTTGDIQSQVENGSFEVTASLDLPSSKDVLIPITLSGVAKFDEDYSATFASQGEKTTVFDLGTNSIGRMVALPDGNIVSINSSSFKFYDILENTTVERQLPSYLDQNEGLFAVSSTILYGRNYRNLYKIDISDIDNILMTPIVSFEGQNISFEQPFTLNGDTFVYQTYNHDAQNRYTYKKVGDADPELVYDENNCCYTPLMINDKIFHIWEDGISEIKDGSRLNDRYFNTFRINKQKLVFYNNEIYALNTNDDNKPGKLVITENQVTFEDLPITEDSTIQSFDFDSLGNLITSNYEYVNGANSYSISSYQLLPQLKIPAGQTTGNFTITGIDDALYELSESLVVSPGTAVNATYSDALVTDGAATPLTLELTDNDDLSEVTYAFSSATIDENSATTVTLTASSVSGAEITIPFTLIQDALSAELGEEYIIVDDVRQIVIPANGNSASIAISTTGLDDTDVEIQEPITFNFGTLVNATSTVSEVTLNLLSDDNSVITAFGTTGDIQSQVENGSFELTASVNLPSSKDVSIPIAFSGVAKLGEDYNVEFASKGEESTILDLGSNASGKMRTLPDGRIVLLNNNSLTIFNIEENTRIEKQLNRNYQEYYGFFAASNTVLYARWDQTIYKIDITDIDDIEETSLITTQGVDNQSFDRPFTFDGETFLYQIYDNGLNKRLLYKKVGDADPELLASYSDCCFNTVIINNKTYAIWDDGIAEMTENGRTGEHIRFNNNVRIDYSKIVFYNNEMYTLSTQNGNQSSNQPGKVILTDNELVFEPISISRSSSIQNFDFDSLGNLISLNSEIINAISSYSFKSYQLIPQLDVLAGQTTGTISIVGEDDDLYELAESLVVSPGTAVNATYSDVLVNNGVITPLTLELTDNDTLSDVTFAFSSPTIDENSATTVTLTASSVSGAEITIPFTLPDDALSAVFGEEYIIVGDVSQIVIPANGNTGSIAISTNGFDDTDVEIIEPIAFNFGTIVNATTQISTIALNLISDDDPAFTGINVSKIEFAEHESTVVTANIDTPSSRDVSIALQFSGTATTGDDYFAEFDNLGAETKIYDMGTSSEGYMKVLPDGRLVYLNGSTLVVVNPEENTQRRIELSTYYWWDRGFEVISNTSLYAIANNGQDIIDIDISDIDNVTETTVVTLASNQQVEKLTFSEDILVYIIYDSNAQNRKYFKKTGIAEVEMILEDNECCDAPVIINNKIYLVRDGNISEITDGVRTFLNSSFNIQKDRLAVYNNTIYAMNRNQNNQVGKLVFPANDQNPVTFEALPIFEDETVQFMDFNQATGNLIIQNYKYSNGNNNYSVSSYQITPLITILAGETSGSLVVNGIEDDLNSPGEEENETVILEFYTPYRAILAENELIEDITLTILNNEIDLVEDLDALVNVPALSFSSVAWGDYDRDGDQDMAIMGRGIQDGVITRIYENVNGVFIENSSLDPRYDGDLMWVDYNKDGYIDLIVSGLDNSDNPATTIYQNIQGTFVPSTDLILPNLFGTSMDSGDLDNDGDIDFVINGMEIINGDNVWRKYIYLREGNSLIKEEDFNNQFEPEYGVKNGSVVIADNQFDGDLDIIIVGESRSKSQINTFIGTPCQSQNWWDCYNNNNNPTDLDYSSMTLFGDYVYYMGITNEEMKIYRRSLVTNQEQEIYGISGLINGSIAIADYNNDGSPDMVLTGENENAESITKLYDGDGYSNFVENTDVSLKGLRNSTANWVDYDVDGDLDLFVSGTSDEGEFTKIYRTDLLNKNNTPSSQISGLLVEDLGYGKIKLSWDKPTDDFSTSLGYVIRLATSSGGSEITNTESNIETGQRLITKSPVIYNTSYETLLDPGVYYWSVQSVDDGLKGSEFSEENTFQLTYEWKELNQGGIIDRSISSVNSPIVRLTDIDFDNDMDLIYGSRENDNDIQIFKLGTKKFIYEENLSNSRSISDIKFLDFNADKVQDVIINTWDKNSNQGSLKLYNTNSSGSYYNNNIFQEVFTSDGLYQSKVELIDINNDGLKEVVHIGRTNAESNSQLKVRVYEQSNGTLDYNYTDISEQFGLLKSGAFAFGNADGDSDIDFAITGLTNDGIKSNLYVNQTESTAVINPVFSEAITEFPSAEDSTLDFFDYDSDGDLDIAITGQGVSGPMFKILSNNGMTGDELEYEEVLNTGLIPIREANLDFGDYNSDGYTDILYSGKVSGQGQVTKLVEFDPTTNSYVDSDFDLSDIINASIAFGDVDGDNDLDFAIAGESSTSGDPIIRTYLNLRDESAAVLEGTGIQTRNGEPEYVVNQRPTEPIGLETEILGYNGDSNTYEVKFSWTGATDESTPTEGLTYALKIGTSDQGDEIMSIKSLDNGYRISAGKGNVEHETSWIINLPDLPDNESYSWTVQSIDAAFSGSPLAESQTLDVDLIKLGDSDGNFVVNVLDLVTDVDYILGYDPSPFVFEAADVNNDETINVLDITATVDIILNPEDDNEDETTRNSSGGMNYYSSSSIGNAIFSWEGNDLFVESEFNVGGVQLTFDTDFEYVLSENLSGIQNLEYIKDDSKTLMLYSFDNTTIANSKTKLLTRTDSSNDIYEDQIIVGTINGEKLNGLLRSSELESNEFNLLNLYPNPSSGTVNVEYYLPYNMDVVNVKIYDIQGRLVWTQELESTSGNIKNQLQLDSLRLGNYILSMNAYKDGILKHISHKRLILK